MVHTSGRTATTLWFAVLAAFAATTIVVADESSIVVRIYDAGGAGPAVRAAAIQTAAAIAEDADIAADWLDCTDPGSRPRCSSSRPARDLIVRIMPGFVPGTPMRRDSVEALESLGESDPPLGFAVVDPATRAGRMATIFHDHVQTVARRTGVEPGELLGRTLAHEIGHLLLQARGHSRTGIMRPVWTDAEMILNRAEDWLFAPLDRARLQRILVDDGQDRVAR